MKKLIFCGILLLILAGCGDEKDNKYQRPDRQMEYYGRIICPRCEKYLSDDIFEQPGQLVACPECKGKAPRGAYCPDMKK